MARRPVGRQNTTAEGLPTSIEPGDWCFIARGVMLHHVNLGPETATVRTALTPATTGPAYFRGLGRILNIARG